MEEKQYMTITEATVYADLSKTLLAQRLRQGRITGQKFGPMWMVDKASLDAYLASNRKPGPKKGSKMPRKGDA